MKPTPETNTEEWTKQEWPGNPSLNLECSCKLFNFHKKVPVFVWGKETFHYTVSAGANSDYSHTGFCVNCNTLDSATAYVDTIGYKLFR